MCIRDKTAIDVPTKIGQGALAERRDELFVLDVRNAEDCEEWSIEGSHDVPVYDELIEEELSGLEGDDEEAVRDAASDLFSSVQRLRELHDDPLVLPGHLGDEEIRPLATTLYGLERNNELVGLDDEEAFVERIVENLGPTPSNRGKGSR